MREVAALRDGAEGNELSGGKRVGDGAGDDELGLDLLDVGHG